MDRASDGAPSGDAPDGPGRSTSVEASSDDQLASQQSPGERSTFALSRRRLFQAGLALCVAPCAAPTPIAGAGRPAIAARRFKESVGICTHPSWRRTIWGTSDWETAVLQLGVQNIRGEVGHGGSGRAALRDLQLLFRSGVKICALIPGNRIDRAAARAEIEFLAGEVGAANLCAIESINEYNNPKRAPRDWPNQLRDFQRWLYDTIKSDPRLSGVPVVAPSIWGLDPKDYRALGNLEPQVDRGCLHYYTGGHRPSRAIVPGAGTRSLAEVLGFVRITAPGKPLYVTEFGYNVASETRPLSAGVISERAAAKYTLRGLFDLFAAGVEKTFVYSLLDDAHTTRHYGLLGTRMNRRASFVALQNLLKLFSDEGREPAPRALQHTISGDADLKRHLFVRSDGAFLLVMYRDLDSYDRATRRDVEVVPRPVRLTFEHGFSRARIFTPTFSDVPIKTVREEHSLVVPVSDHVIAVEIVPSDGGRAS